jgi:lipopolysaccharide biosynthesis glycosyltransferase
MNPIIVCAADNTYAMPLAVMLRSLVEGTGDSCAVTVYIIDGGISRRNKERVASSLSGRRINIEWLLPDPESLSAMPVFGYVSVCTYYKLLIPDLLPANVPRVLYLDVDILITADVREIWELPFNGEALLAVRDSMGAICNCKNLASFFNGVPNPERHPYLNAGVMLLDLVRWRNESLAAKISKYIAEREKTVCYHEQDGINAVLYDSWGELPPKWNMQIPCLYRGVNAARVQNQSAHAIDNGIYHFACRLKPWQYGASHLARNAYYECLDRTAWKGWRPRMNPRDILLYLKARLFNRYYYGAIVRRTPLVRHLWIWVRGHGE